MEGRCWGETGKCHVTMMVEVRVMLPGAKEPTDSREPPAASGGGPERTPLAASEGSSPGDGPWGSGLQPPEP